MKIHHGGEKKDCILVAVEGRMDAVSAPEFETFLGNLIDEGALKIIVDFEGLDYISSAGLRSVLVVAKKIQGKNGEILLTSLHDTVKEIFEISGFDTIIPIHESVDSALETL
ncbi:STAS domain protein [delta proteobacterium NaphS2]|nr:STAS domain protein [delta proteobacterium NaphS2]